MLYRMLRRATRAVSTESRARTLPPWSAKDNAYLPLQARGLASAEVTVPDASREFRGKTSEDEASRTREQSERAVRARHVLRAILRECTYLPDSFARQWVRQHVLSRFRTYTFKEWKHRDNEDFEIRLRTKEKEARHWVAYLRRANAGERMCLTRVLFMTYGRIGKRRYDLMVPLLSKPAKTNASRSISVEQDEDVGPNADEAVSQDQPDDHEMQDALRRLKIKPNTTATRKYTPDLTPQLRALLISQMQAAPLDLTRRNPRRLTLEIPLFNAWLRPMPPNRIKNMEKKHYADLLDRVLPPLPTDEWRRLFGLSNGSMPIEPPVPRRPTAAPMDEAEIRRPCNNALETVLAYGKPPARLLDINKGHALTPRYMRRLYAHIFGQCPLMDWNAETEEWKITWGEQALRRIVPTSSSAGEEVDTAQSVDEATTDNSETVAAAAG